MSQHQKNYDYSISLLSGFALIIRAAVILEVEYKTYKYKEINNESIFVDKMTYIAGNMENIFITQSLETRPVSCFCKVSRHIIGYYSMCVCLWVSEGVVSS